MRRRSFSTWIMTPMDCDYPWAWRHDPDLERLIEETWSSRDESLEEDQFRLEEQESKELKEKFSQDRGADYRHNKWPTRQSLSPGTALSEGPNIDEGYIVDPHEIESYLQRGWMVSLPSVWYPGMDSKFVAMVKLCDCEVA
jgi:hypothetical protein